MNGAANPVDIAMVENRPAKQAIRSLWLEEIKAVARESPVSDEPWYLTLPGAEGLDIKLIIEEGLVSLTEVNSIAEEDQWKIVAVERNNQAILRLQEKFIGLNIKEADFGSLIHGDGPFAWPRGENEKYCRARIVNLDLNSPLRARQDEDLPIFPIMEWIKKLCQIHARPPRTDWTLCLTLHGDIHWPESVNNWIKELLHDNFDRDATFANSCEGFMGERLYGQICQDEFDLISMTDDELQKFIMVMVPKLIARFVTNLGWRVQTERNLKYGGGSHARMVTWIVKFFWDGMGIARPEPLYRSALNNIFSGVGMITDNGEVTLL